MPDPISVGLLGVAGSLLGSLVKASPKDAFEVEKLLDTNDPVRKSLEAIKEAGITGNEHILMANGERAEIVEILEIGYGAVRLRMDVRSVVPNNSISRLMANDPSRVPEWSTKWKRTSATVRFSAILAVESDEKPNR